MPKAQPNQGHPGPDMQGSGSLGIEKSCGDHGSHGNGQAHFDPILVGTASDYQPAASGKCVARAGRFQNLRIAFLRLRIRMHDRGLRGHNVGLLMSVHGVHALSLEIYGHMGWLLAQ